MPVVSNKAYIDKERAAHIHLSVADSDKEIIKDLVADLFDCYKRDLIISYRNDVVVPNGSGANHSLRINDKTDILVAIISKNFFDKCESGFCMKEFQYALDESIPIIPIIIQNGVEKLFNKKCGKLELIYRDKESYSAILQETIHSILNEVELKSDIRNHLGSRIFLSYRRDDLLIAQKVMKSIHEVDIFENIGIWYDASLVPGKDFEKEIFDQIDKCNCVLMIISNRIFAKNNYIMREYPIVKNKGIKILPYFVEDVDCNKLSMLYPGILDEYSNGIRSFSELQKILTAVINADEYKKIAEYYYYLGMAFLYGVDFETNEKKAVEYLEKAAGENYIDAVRLLCNIYHDGATNIEKDINKAITFQIKYIDYLIDSDETDISDDDFVDEIIKLTKMLEKANKYDIGILVIDNIINDVERHLYEQHDAEYYYLLVRLYENKAFFEKAFNNYSNSRNALGKADHYIDEASRYLDLAQQKEYDLKLAEFSTNYAKILYEFCMDKADLKLALDYVNVALNQFDRYWEIVDSNDYKEKFSEINYLYGLIEYEIAKIEQHDGSKLDSVIESYEWSIDLLSTALEFCVEPDFMNSVRDVKSYGNFTKIHEAIMRISYHIFKLKNDTRKFDKYKGSVNTLIEIYTNVLPEKMVHDSLKKLIEQIIKHGDDLACCGYRKLACELYVEALKGLQADEFLKEREAYNLNRKIINVSLGR